MKRLQAGKQSARSNRRTLQSVARGALVWPSTCARALSAAWRDRGGLGVVGCSRPAMTKLRDGFAEIIQEVVAREVRKAAVSVAGSPGGRVGNGSAGEPSGSGNARGRLGSGSARGRLGKRAAIGRGVGLRGSPSHPRRGIFMCAVCLPTMPASAPLRGAAPTKCRSIVSLCTSWPASDAMVLRARRSKTKQPDILAMPMSHVHRPVGQTSGDGSAGRQPERACGLRRKFCVACWAREGLSCCL